MKYVEFINQETKKLLGSCTFPVVVFGQNVNAGSYMGGLTKGFNECRNVKMINTPNCELTLCGVGMGMMASGMNCIFVMKQLDFLLLGMDQLTHTWNVLKNRKGIGSFTIFTVITDNGLEGKQSCFQRMQDLCHCANVDGFEITGNGYSKSIIENIINMNLIRGGFRIIAVSQTLLQKETE
jgi:pyruvate/2-oxoglutarate/acetoin dehydrogenase E1 component